MAYIINLTDGSIFATVADGTINTDSSMTLIGRNYAGYGEFLDENFIHLLENGSNTTPPPAPLTGQLWWDKSVGLLKVYTGSDFKPLSSSTSSTTAPTNNTIGDLWYDISNQQLKVWTGSNWLLVGPAFTSGTGTTGAIVSTIVDNALVSHVVIKLYINDSIVGIISKDAAFTPQASIPGFSQVLPGITLASIVGSQVPLFQGTATNAQTLNSLSSSSFMRTDASTSTTGTLAVLNDNGLTVGSDSDFKTSVTGINVNLQNQTQNGNLIFKVNVGGSPTTVATLSSSGLNLDTALTAPSGGTGLSLYTVGDILYANTTTSLTKLPDVAIGNSLISGGVGIAPSWGKVGLTTHVSGTLPVTNGGTGASSLTANNVLLGNGTSAPLTVAPGNSGNVLVSNGTTWNSSSILTLQTPQTTTTGTFKDFTGIPSGVKRITIMFGGVSLNGTSTILIQLGDSGGIENTGYSSAGTRAEQASTASVTTSTAGFVIFTNVAASVLHGSIVLNLYNSTSFSWAAHGAFGTISGTPYVYTTAGTKSLSAELTRVRITSGNGTDAFDAGEINILYE